MIKLKRKMTVCLLEVPGSDKITVRADSLTGPAISIPSGGHFPVNKQKTLRDGAL